MADIEHQILVHRADVTNARIRIETKLGVETTVLPGMGRWAIRFTADEDVDLSFLRPDVLPPIPDG